MADEVEENGRNNDTGVGARAMIILKRDMTSARARSPKPRARTPAGRKVAFEEGV